MSQAEFFWIVSGRGSKRGSRHTVSSVTRNGEQEPSFLACSFPHRSAQTLVEVRGRNTGLESLDCQILQQVVVELQQCNNTLLDFCYNTSHLAS